MGGHMELYLGKAKSGKTEAIYRAIGERILNGTATETMLIVPEQYTLEAEKQLIRSLGTMGFIGVEIVSLKRLSHKILSEVGRSIGTHITQTGKQMLLQNVFLQQEWSLKYYQNAYEKAGFLSRFLDLIQEFKQNRVTFEEVITLSRQMNGHALLKYKLDDIGKIMEAYELAKGEHYFDDQDLMEAFIDAIPSSKWIKQMVIYVDGFDSFTIQEHQILQALCQHSSQVVMTLPIEAHTSDTGVKKSCFKHTLRTLSMIQLYPSESIDLIAFNHRYMKMGFEHIAENIVQYPHEIFSEKNVPEVEVFSAASIQTEVAYVCTQILKCVHEKGLRFDEIAVVTNGLENYQTPLTHLLTTYQIPFFLDAKVGISHQPITHFIMALLDLPLNPKNSQGVIQLLKTGLLNYPEDLVFEFELYVKAYGIRVFQFEKPFEKEPLGKYPLETLCGLRTELLDPVSTLLKLHKDSEQMIQTYTMTFYRLIEKLQLEHSVISLSNNMEQNGELIAAQEVIQVWNAIVQLMDEMVLLMGERIVSYSEWVSIFKVGLDSIEIGRLPLEKNVVLVGNMDRSKSHPIKALFLLGLNEGILPEAGGTQQLFMEAEKEIMMHNGQRMLSDSEMFVEKEQFNLYTTLTRPSDWLFLSYANSDAEGRSMRASSYVGKIKKICPNLEIKYETRDMKDLEGNPFWVYGYGPTYQQLALAFRKYLDGYELDHKWYEVMAWYKKYNSADYERVIQAMLHQNVFAPLKMETVEKIYASPLKTSVSALETYAQCPFKYFVKTGLAPEKEKRFVVEYPDVGILFHETLEAFGKKLYEEKKLWREIDDAASDQFVDEIVNEMVDTDLYQSKFSYRYMANKLKRVSKRAVKTLRYHLAKGDFMPQAFELNFGKGINTVPPIIITLSNGKQIHLRGVIDRVDILRGEDQDYVKIIDYKSGSKHLTLSEVYYGLQMQLLVYLKACLGRPEYFKATTLYPGGAFYFKIDDPFIDNATKVKDYVEENLLDALKMDGICLEEKTVLNGLDVSLMELGKSDVVKVKFKTSGDLTKDSMAVSLEAFNALMLWVEEMIREIGESILDGDMSISPCKIGGFTSCQYCDYSAICQFDVKFEGNQYRVLKVLDNEVVLERLIGGINHVDQ